jgi:nucleoside-diphosphate-sugar epimerase
MRVLLLGATGRVGTRLLPALLAHDHTVVVYTRDRRRLQKGLEGRRVTTVEGCATDVEAIKQTISSYNCDAVVNSAGRASIIGTNDDFANIFAAVARAAAEVQQERLSAPLRCWLLSGWPILDSPKTGLPLLS